MACAFLACKQDQATVTPAPETVAATKTTQKTTPPPKVMTEATLDLTKYGIANDSRNVLGGLKVGDKAPDFELKSNRGRVIKLSEYTEHTPVVLSFFRGDWCGYCTKHLAEFQDNFKMLSTDKRTRIIAVTPQKMDDARKMASDMGIFYSVISDEDHQVMKDYKVFYHTTPEYNQKVVKAKGQSLNAYNNDTEPVLPVPATYVIGSDMHIKYVFYDPDYSKRPPVEDLLSALD